MPVKGGAKLAAHIRNQLEKSPVSKVTVGIFPESQYPDGMPVAAVAAFQEFGVKGYTPQRPAWRPAIAEARQELRRLLIRRAEASGLLRVDHEGAVQIGQLIQTIIRDNIRAVRFPPNAPSTIAGKGRSQPPLQDTLRLINAVDWKAE